MNFTPELSCWRDHIHCISVRKVIPAFNASKDAVEGVLRTPVALEFEVPVTLALLRLLAIVSGTELLPGYRGDEGMLELPVELGPLAN